MNNATLKWANAKHAAPNSSADTADSILDNATNVARAAQYIPIPAIRTFKARHSYVMTVTSLSYQQGFPKRLAVTVVVSRK
jgi:hypothetical protein